MHDLTVPKWLYLFPPTCYLEPADELCSFSLSADFLSLLLFLIPHPSDGSCSESYSPKNRFTRNKCTLLFTLSLSMRFVSCHTRSSLFAYVYVFSSALRCTWMTLQVYEYEHVQKPMNAFSFMLPMLFHFVIPHSRCNILLFRSPTINLLNCCWHTSKCFRLAVHSLSISNTQVDGNRKEMGLQNILCVVLRVYVCGEVCACFFWSAEVVKKMSGMV